MRKRVDDLFNGPAILFILFIYFPQAYKKWVEDNGEEYVLPELKKSSEELFFIGYAQVSRPFYVCSYGNTS